jgi:diguanylate cyclase (GGDEF)-like protein
VITPGVYPLAPEFTDCGRVADVMGRDRVYELHSPEPRAFRPSWICPGPLERERFLDIHQRLVPLNAKLMVLMAVVLIPLGWSMPHPWLLAPIGVAMLLFGLAQREATRCERPENVVFLALLAGSGAIAAIARFAPGETDTFLTLMCWPAAGVAGRFRGAAAVVGVSVIAGCIVAVQLSVDLAAMGDHPLRVTTPIVAIICVAFVVSAFRDSDVEHRGAATVDALTTLLNRRALMQRVTQLEQQSARTDEPIGLALVDLDLFKSVNDRYGHATGDAVLAHIGSVLRQELRAYDLAYRLGGEEFVVLMPGATLADMEQRAEDIRRAIERASIDGVSVTASVGITASAPGELFRWSEHFERADRAVYGAKRAGRNRVATGIATGDAHAQSGIRRYLASNRS